MRPLTDSTPKPMIEIHGQPILSYAIELLAAQDGLETITINTHAHADQIHDYIGGHGKRRPQLITSYEPRLLDTGGGIVRMAETLSRDEPFFCLSGDSILLDAPNRTPLLTRMRESWKPESMDLLLALYEVARLPAEQRAHPAGDYDLAEDGRPIRRTDKSGRYIWTSARLCHKRLLDGAPKGAFSFLELMDRAEKAGRLAAIIHEGIWHHLTRPEDVHALNTEGAL